MAFRFLDLPAELRDAVYDEILHPECFRQHLSDGYSRYKFDLALFHVNRQVASEAQAIFYKNFTFVRLETPGEEDQVRQIVEIEGHVPIIARGDKASAFQGYTLNAVISVPDIFMYHNEDTEIQRLLLLVDDLHLFCQRWFYSDLDANEGLNPHLKLTLTLRVPFQDKADRELPLSLQKRLMLPFGLIKGVPAVTVQGSCDDKILEAMLNEMKVPYSPAENLLEEATKLKDAGNELLKKKLPDQAIVKYIDAYRAMHIVCIDHYRGIFAERFFNRYLIGGIYDGKHGQVVRLVLRTRLVANIMKAYLDMRRYDEAEFWGNRTVTLIRDSMGGVDDEAIPNFPAAEQLGKIYYRAGIASKMLGKIYEARKLFRVAYEYLPQDEFVRRELAAASPMLG
ncbi:hypothetical protein BT63DRAFT_124143 [Microthyrium microscopicum]|uniref:Tetratricopeptide repeat domain-containing protein n=1 Tax=Microthyrium microscopicum TaxID=703497 RepID=A0A6A6TTZ9_9PEZI|nr:hypothetical protein BT63DRAFT_124143 [Microthyrium microscopicum]